MTNEKRDALIEKAAEAMVEYDNPGVYERGDVIADWDDYVGAARAALAVFEQAHTPTDDELKALLADAAAYTDGYTEEDASGPIKIIIRLVTALRHPVQAEQAHTPTDDERERIEQSNDIAYTVIEVAQNKAPEEFVALDFRYGIADALWDAGYRKARRTVQAHTPSDDEREALAETIYLWDTSENVGASKWGDLTEKQRDVWREGADFLYAAGFRRPVQAEPTDAQVAAAARAIFSGYVGETSDGFDKPTYAYDREKAEHVAGRALRAALKEGSDRG